MHQAYQELRKIEHRHMGGGEPTDRNRLHRERGARRWGTVEVCRLDPFLPQTVEEQVVERGLALSPSTQ